VLSAVQNLENLLIIFMRNDSLSSKQGWISGQLPIRLIYNLFDTQAIIPHQSQAKIQGF